MQKQDFSNNDNKPKMPKFNMNWLYVMILIALCVTFFTDGGSSYSFSCTVKWII